jgi:hypothetical protein
MRQIHPNQLLHKPINFHRHPTGMNNGAGEKGTAAMGMGDAPQLPTGERTWRPDDVRRETTWARDGGMANQPAPLGTKRGNSEAINRVKAKLCGQDFNPFVEISVAEQVDRLIEQATLNDNLCQCYIGWCPFW